MSLELGLKHKVALVTGSTGGIGAAIAQGLAREGARVMVHGTPGQAGEAWEVSQSIHAAGGEAEVQLASLEDPDACRTLIDSVVDRFGRIDLLVNNAASSARGDLAATDARLFDAILQVNLRAPLLLIRAALPRFRMQGGGRVLNIGSINAYCGDRNLLAYSISKAGLTTLTKNLARALGGEGIRVNQINPGWVLTRGEYELRVREGMSANWPQQIPRENAPGGRIFAPNEIAYFALALLGDSAGLVNGTVVDLDQFPTSTGNPLELPKA